MTPDDFTEWADKAKPGDRIVYYTSQQMSYGRNPMPLFRNVYEHAVAGSVALVQKKYDFLVYEYIAIKLGRNCSLRLIPRLNASDDWSDD